MTSGIYKITEKTTGFIYIGQAKVLSRRLREHKEYRGLHMQIDQLIYEKGVDQFNFEIIEYCPEELLNERERYWITFYDSYNKGYNNTPGGHGATNRAKGEKVNTANLTNEEVLQYRKDYTYMAAQEIYEKYQLDARVSYISFERALMGRTFKFLPIYKKRENIWISTPGYDCSNFPLRQTKIDSTGKWKKSK